MDVLTVEGLSKRYVIGGSNDGHAATSLRAAIGRSVSRTFGTERHAGEERGKHEFWALKNISFEVAEGTRLGIIGRNGAGKSTLLKIMSRTTEPTEGRLLIHGRTASLLEIGTGFHPELSGRENIFLNGTLLGMTRDEIKRKMEAIIEFAEIEEFLDTPVKHYSSGMYVRLGFAVAAHVDPDILLLDEVLAVGDLQFQRKCFGKMQELGDTARSVLFVSHDLSAISALCNRCILLEHGRLVFDGTPAEAILRYYEHNVTDHGELDFEQRGVHVGDSDAQLLGAEIALMDGKPALEADIREPFRVTLRYRIMTHLDGPTVPNVHFYRPDGTCAFVALPEGARNLGPGEYRATVIIPGRFLNEGMYSIRISLTTFFGTHHKTHLALPSALMINIRDPRDGTTGRYGYGGQFPGAVRPRFEWTIGEE